MDIVRDVNTYKKILEKRISTAEQRSFPESVRRGDVARLIIQAFRYVHERVDENGDVIPESRVVALKEASNYVARLCYIGTHGRPPDLDARQVDLRDFKPRPKT
jgi:hypothetical protein